MLAFKCSIHTECLLPFERSHIKFLVLGCKQKAPLVLKDTLASLISRPPLIPIPFSTSYPQGKLWWEVYFTKAFFTNLSRPAFLSLSTTTRILIESEDCLTWSTAKQLCSEYCQAIVYWVQPPSNLTLFLKDSSFYAWLAQLMVRKAPLPYLLFLKPRTGYSSSCQSWSTSLLLLATWVVRAFPWLCMYPPLHLSPTRMDLTLDKRQLEWVGQARWWRVLGYYFCLQV